MRILLLCSMLLALPASAQNTPEGALLLVANKQEASLSIIDVASGRLLATGRLAVVANYGAQAPGSSLTVVNLATRKVLRTIDLGEYRRPHGIVVLPGDSLALVTSEANRATVLVSLERGVVSPPGHQ